MTQTPQPPHNPQPPQNRLSRPVQGADGNRYRVVAVKKGMPFRDIAEGAADDPNPLSAVLTRLIAMIISAVDLRGRGSTTWKVGVFRVGRLREKLVHRELLEPGLDPGQRMGDLVEWIAQGESEGTGEDRGPHHP